MSNMGLGDPTGRMGTSRILPHTAVLPLTPLARFSRTHLYVSLATAALSSLLGRSVFTCLVRPLLRADTTMTSTAWAVAAAAMVWTSLQSSASKRV